MTDYQITPVAVDGFADANGVYQNREGTWLGEVNGEEVVPYCDEDLDFVPAPENWRDLIIEWSPRKPPALAVRRNWSAAHG